MVESVEIVIKRVIANELDLDWEQINDTDDFVADLGADSVDSSLIISSINSYYNLSITFEQASEFKIVSDLIGWVTERIE